jgi:hypothetical protein
MFLPGSERGNVQNITTVYVVCTENVIRVDDVMESPKLAE